MEPWAWQDDAYKLDSESPLAISQSFWQDLSQTEATSRSLFASTPAPERVQPFPFGLPTSDAAASSLCPESVAGALRGAARAKRRRMLCFPGVKNEAQPGCEAQYGSGNDEGYAVSEEYDASNWYLRSGPDEPCTCVEGSGGHCEKWVDRCLGDNSGSRDNACDQTRNFLEGEVDACASASGGEQMPLYSSNSEAQCSMNNEGQDSVEVSQGSYECCYGAVQCREARECSADDTGDLHHHRRQHKKPGVDRPPGKKSKSQAQSPVSPTVEAGDESESEEAAQGPLTPLPTRPTIAAGAGRSKKGSSRGFAAVSVCVAYPFAVLKPSNAQGDVTLHDINKRLSSPCAQRGRRAAAGPAAKRRKKSSRNSNSTSGGSPATGSAVVAQHTVRTQGAGSVTIKKTKA